MGKGVRVKGERRSSKLFGGKTAKEAVWSALGWRCVACKRPAFTQISIIAPYSDFAGSPAQLRALSALWGGGAPPTVETVNGTYLTVSRIYVCDACRPEAEKAAAKHPDHWHADIYYAPGKERTVVAMRS